MIDRLMRGPRAGVALAANLAAAPMVARDIVGALSRGAFRKARHMARTASHASDLRAEKIVSRKYGYLWLCVPKVASRSIMRTLRNADPDAEVLHDMRICDVYAMHPEARDYYSFAFVRHPFDRTLSFHRELHCAHTIYGGAQRLHKGEKRQSFFRRFHGLAETRSFDDVCRWLNTPYGSDAFADRHFLSQHLQVRLDDGCLPDFIGRLENLDEDLKQVAMKVGMPAPALPRLNTMAGWQATSSALRAARWVAKAHLTEQNKALLRTRYAGDLELWTKVRETAGVVEDRVHPSGERMDGNDER